MAYVVDESLVQRVLDELTINREKRRRIQGYSRQEMQTFLVTLYRKAFEDGLNALENELAKKAEIEPEDDTDEVQIEWEDVLETIGSVRGVTDELLARIGDKMTERFG